MKQEYNKNPIYRVLYLFIGFYRFVGTVWNKIEKRERQVALKLGSLEVLNLVNYDNNPQRIRNQIAIPSSYIKILKGDNFKECYQVPNHEVEDESIRSYQIKCQF